MKEKVLEKINELNLIVQDNFGASKIPTFNISYELSSSNRLWTVSFKKKWVTLNPPIMNLNEHLLNEYWEIYINEVVVHEYAHLVVNKFYPSWFNASKIVKPHWKEFKAISSYFWYEGKSTSKLFKDSEVLKAKKRNVKRWSYKCDCMIHEVSTQKHKKIQQGWRYICKNCNWVLRK